MNRKNRYLLSITIFVLVITAIVVGRTKEIQSQVKYPTKAIDIIVPYSPGGGCDLSARIVAAYLTKRWATPVNVINRPGGNGIPACLEVHKALPNGYTLLMDSQNTASCLEFIGETLPFKILDRTFIAFTDYTPNILVVPSTSPVKNLKDLEAEVKRDPGNFTWGSLGGFSTNEINMKQFLNRIGVKASATKPVAFPGGAQIVAAVAGGHIKAGLSGPPATLPLIKQGLIRAVGIAGTERHPYYADLPTNSEQGYPTPYALYWMGISGPPNMPSYLIDKLDKALEEAFKDPEFISKFTNIGAIPFYRNSYEARKYIVEETQAVKKIFALE